MGVSFWLSCPITLSALIGCSSSRHFFQHPLPKYQGSLSETSQYLLAVRKLTSESGLNKNLAVQGEIVVHGYILNVHFWGRSRSLSPLPKPHACLKTLSLLWNDDALGLPRFSEPGKTSMGWWMLVVDVNPSHRAALPRVRAVVGSKSTETNEMFLWTCGLILPYLSVCRFAC